MSNGAKSDFNIPGAKTTHMFPNDRRVKKIQFLYNPDCKPDRSLEGFRLFDPEGKKIFEIGNLNYPN